MLSELQGIFGETMKKIEQEQEEFWSSLSEEQKLQAFCAVVRRIYEAEIVDQGTYRYVLYDTFGFGPESYAQAQCAGYLSLHNCFSEATDYYLALKAIAENCLNEDTQEFARKIIQWKM